jgi:SAM-dependent methyltransferase
MQQPTYNTWIRKKKIVVFGVITLALLVLAAITMSNWWLSLLFVTLAAPFAYITFIISYSYVQFSKAGGDYQSKIHDLVVDTLSSKSGKLLDIGTGSASLTIKAAKKLPKITATGLDYWGTDWDYSKKLCEKNAEIEGVGDHMTFVQGSASKLPFEDGTFDIVVSCLTFHEVNDESDKTKVLHEALRVLRSGGEFVFMDLFLDQEIFGDVETVFGGLGVKEVLFSKLDSELKLPKLLLGTKVLGNAMLVRGFKK